MAPPCRLIIGAIILDPFIVLSSWVSCLSSLFHLVARDFVFYFLSEQRSDEKEGDKRQEITFPIQDLFDRSRKRKQKRRPVDNPERKGVNKR
jgi:hypothetical protein